MRVIRHETERLGIERPVYSFDTCNVHTALEPEDVWPGGEFEQFRLAAYMPDGHQVIEQIGRAHV